VSFSMWIGKCQRWWSNLSSMDLSFFLFSSLLKITAWSYLLMVFQLQSLFFWFLIFILSSFVEVLFVFNFIIQSQFTKYCIFQFGLYFFYFIIFFPWPFYKSFIGFQFYSSIQIDGIIFFNSVFIILISNLFVLALL